MADAHPEDVAGEQRCFATLVTHVRAFDCIGARQHWPPVPSSSSPGMGGDRIACRAGQELRGAQRHRGLRVSN